MTTPPSRHTPPVQIDTLVRYAGHEKSAGEALIRGARRWLGRRRRAILGFLYGIWPFFALYTVLYLVMSSLFYAVEEGQYSWPQSLYFAVGIFSGVTYSDVYATNGAARVLSAVGVLLFVFLLALVVTGFGKRADEANRQNALGLLGTDMKGHYIVIGSDAVAQVAARDLLHYGLKVAMLMERPEDVDRLRPLAPPEQLFLSFGAPAEWETLKRLNLPDCRSVIVSMADDSLSVIVALLIRTYAPQIPIIVSATRPELRSTIRTAGVTFVASPLEMGGRICASAAFEPDVARTLDELTTVAVGASLEEFVLRENAPLVGKTFREAAAEVSSRTDCVLVGYSRGVVGDSTPKPSLAPKGDAVLCAGDALIIVARAEQSTALESWLGVTQGR